MLPRQLHAVVLVKVDRLRFVRESARARELVMQQALQHCTYLMSVIRRPYLPICCEIQEVAPVPKEGQRDSMKRKERHIGIAQVFNELIASLS